MTSSILRSLSWQLIDTMVEKTNRPSEQLADIPSSSQTVTAGFQPTRSTHQVNYYCLPVPPMGRKLSWPEHTAD